MKKTIRNCLTSITMTMALLYTVAYASESIPCPAVSEIKKVPFTNGNQTSSSLLSKHAYFNVFSDWDNFPTLGTDRKWILFFQSLESDSLNNAITKANNLRNQLYDDSDYNYSHAIRLDSKKNQKAYMVCSYRPQSRSDLALLVVSPVDEIFPADFAIEFDS